MGKPRNTRQEKDRVELSSILKVEPRVRIEFKLPVLGTSIELTTDKGDVGNYVAESIMRFLPIPHTPCLVFAYVGKVIVNTIESSVGSPVKIEDLLRERGVDFLDPSNINLSDLTAEEKERISAATH